MRKIKKRVKKQKQQKTEIPQSVSERIEATANRVKDYQHLFATNESIQKSLIDIDGTLCYLHNVLLNAYSETETIAGADILLEVDGFIFVEAYDKDGKENAGKTVKELKYYASFPLNMKDLGKTKFFPLTYEQLITLSEDRAAVFNVGCSPFTPKTVVV